MYDAFFVSGWVVGLLLLPMLVRRYDPNRAWAWLAVIFGLSWLGLLLFLLIADNPLGRVRRQRYALEQLDVEQRLAQIRPYFVEHPTEDVFWGIDRLSHAFEGLTPVGGNDAQVLCEEPQMIDRLVEDIEAARQHVHLTMYIFADDRTGRRVAEAMVRAVQRGVTCRVLADALGSRAMFRELGAWMRRNGVDLREAMPVRMFWRKRFYRIDVRNHRKLVVIDGAIAHIGSRNMVNLDYGDPELGPCHELMVRASGPIVYQLHLSFLEDWYLETGQTLVDPLYFPEPRPVGPHVMQALSSGPMYPGMPVRDVAVAAIHAARDRVLLTMPYLVPDDVSIHALRLAAMRGVRVDIVASTKSDSWLAQAAGRAYFAEMLAAGVHVHLHPRSMVHSKALTVDHTFSMVGSANFDSRSFRLNMETNLLIYSPPLVSEIAAVQQRYIDAGREIDRQQWLARPWRKQFADDLVKMLGPLV